MSYGALVGLAAIFQQISFRLEMGFTGIGKQGIAGPRVGFRALCSSCGPARLEHARVQHYRSMMTRQLAVVAAPLYHFCFSFYLPTAQTIHSHRYHLYLRRIKHVKSLPWIYLYLSICYNLEQLRASE